jgi:transcriptional regulator with XRE-family HTH domain
MVLFRRLLGDVLRDQRTQRGLTLREVSAEARVSLGYISEIERGQKEASSELLVLAVRRARGPAVRRAA